MFSAIIQLSLEEQLNWLCYKTQVNNIHMPEHWSLQQQSQDGPVCIYIMQATQTMQLSEVLLQIPAYWKAYLEVCQLIFKLHMKLKPKL